MSEKQPARASAPGDSGPHPTLDVPAGPPPASPRGTRGVILAIALAALLVAGFGIVTRV